MSHGPRNERTTTSRAARVFAILAWLAILGHLSLSTHHAAVAHEIGADGHLHHACASHGEHAHADDDSDRSPSDPERPEDPGDGEPCPLQKPCVDTGLGFQLAVGAWTPFVAAAPAERSAAAPEAPLDVLDIAPKQSPPQASLRS
jgi:hypothetical protein